jgi:membrane protein
MHPMSQRLIDGTPRRLRPAVELVIRTIDGVFRDRVPGLAAEIAFFTMLSLPALLLTVLASVGFVGDLLGREWRTAFADEIITGTGFLLSDDGQEVFGELVQALVTESRGGFIGIGFLIAIYTASRAFRVVTTALVIAYDLRATRPPWKDRLWGLVLTFGGLIAAMVIGPVLIAGPEGGRALSELVGGIPGLPEVWAAFYWPTTGLVLTLLIALLYDIAAPWSTPYWRDLPGALLAMLLWLAGSAGLRIYVGQAIDATYGFIATPLVILLWIWVSAIVLLLGAELNAAIEHMWPSTARRKREDAERDRAAADPGDRDAGSDADDPGDAVEADDPGDAETTRELPRPPTP